jgi:hypothetical protein
LAKICRQLLRRLAGEQKSENLAGGTSPARHLGDR